MRPHPRTQRQGAALVLLIVALVPLMAFLALAVDLGLLAVARSQCQNAADSAAMAATRALNGVVANNNNYSAATPAAQSAVVGNQVLSKQIETSQLTTQIGRFVYNQAAQRFEGQFPGPGTESWSMVRTQVTADVNNQMGFAKIFSFAIPSVQARATAAHRPRDVCVVLDFSGSMRFASLMGTPYSGNRNSNNGDDVFPLFGHYSATSSAQLQATSFSSPYSDTNLSRTTGDQRPAIVADFYSDSAGTPAFTYQSTAYETTPGGDNCLKQNFNTSSSYATTVAAVLNLSSGSVTNSTRNATWESQGYSMNGMNASYAGYTLGPGYWGKTFFIWPPDPRTQWDWRRRFFTYPGYSSSQPVDNRRLWDSSGNWLAPSNSGYQINYSAILAWIKSGPQVFPNRLQSGRILYYDSIPDSIPSQTGPLSDPNQRFWKEYIDYCLGLSDDYDGSWTVISSGTGSHCGKAGYGADYTYGTIRVTAASSLTATGNPATKPYMHYLDNPKRPRLHFWFGPLSMIDFLGNYNLFLTVSPQGSRYCWWPGTCHEAPMYACKLGVRAALQDIERNHPNDLMSLIFFSSPATSSSAQNGRFNRVRVGLSRSYTRMNEALWYPPSTLENSSATVRPFSSDNLEVPRAYGGTCYAMPLMLAYNQFSENSSLRSYNSAEPTGDAGGNGRRGAQKIIIFETDGMPNTLASASFTNSGPYQSYYRVRYNSGSPGSSEFPTNVSGSSDNSNSVVSQIQTICSQICASDTAGNPGFSRGSKPVLIHCIGFGPIFDAGSSTRDDALGTLDAMQQIGNVDDGMPDYKIITGSQDQMISRLQEAFTRIMQTGVQVSLIE